MRTVKDAPYKYRAKPVVVKGGKPVVVNPADSQKHTSHSSHHSHNSLGLGLYVGGSNWGIGIGYSNGYYGSGLGVSLGYGYGSGAWFCASALHGSSYSSCWNHYYNGCSPLASYHLGYVAPFGAAVPASYYGFVSQCRYNFGYSYYHPHSWYTPYPFYRTTCYEPYFVSSYSYSVPVYRSYYYTNSYDGSYVDSIDPYVDQEPVLDPEIIEEVSYASEGGNYGWLAATPSTPDPFATPFVQGFTEGLDVNAYLAMGEKALFDGNYMDAAEAFRRAMLMNTADSYAAFQLGTALFAAGDYQFSSMALRRGLANNPAWIHRRFDLAQGFASPEEFASRVQFLERHLIKNETDLDARFVLAYTYFYSNNLFGARSVIRDLRSAQYDCPALSEMGDEAAIRLSR